MSVLIVTQKNLIQNPVFKQDQNNLDIYNILKEKYDVKILYLHRSFISKGKSNNNEPLEKKDVDINEIKIDAEQFCFRDMLKLKKSLLKKNINIFLKEHNITTIIFMSYYMAQAIFPYIYDIIQNINIICDLRISSLSYILQQYKEEKEKEYQYFQSINKSFRRQFVRNLAIIKYSNHIILDESCDVTLLEKEKVNNIIDIKSISDCVENKKILSNKNVSNSSSVLSLIINRNNYYMNNNCLLFKNNDNEYVVNETIKGNIIDSINKIIYSTKADYICMYSNKINKLPNIIDLIIENLSLSDKFALASPLIQYSREMRMLKAQFENQRNNNFSNWEETQPLSYSDFVVIKKKYFNKIGYFDNRFKTLDYAIFDFVLRLHQINSYYCTMNDVVVFKPINITKNISLFKKDRLYLCQKWGEKSFNIGI